MKKIVRNITFSILLLGASFPASVSAAVQSSEDVERIIRRLSGWMYSILIALSVVFILVAAYNFLFAGGDKNKLEAAKNQITYAVIAIVLAIIATGIVKIVQQFLT